MELIFRFQNANLFDCPNEIKVESEDKHDYFEFAEVVSKV